MRNLLILIFLLFPFGVYAQDVTIHRPLGIIRNNSVNSWSSYRLSKPKGNRNSSIQYYFGNKGVNATSYRYKGITINRLNNCRLCK